jgi:Asp/Glu/hydantoin racemase
MNDRKLVLLHTLSPLIQLFSQLMSEALPDVKPLHILDEPLLERIKFRGGLAAADAERVQQHRLAAGDIGADAILVTCSTVSPCADQVRAWAGIPILKIDEAMIAEAVKSGRNIGVLATASSTLKPTQQMLLAQSQLTGIPIIVELKLVEGALAALLSGDYETHDRLVCDAIRELSKRSDVVMLAQASMSRVLATIPVSERQVPVLSSPHLALAQVRRLLFPEGESFYKYPSH